MKNRPSTHLPCLMLKLVALPTTGRNTYMFPHSVVWRPRFAVTVSPSHHLFICHNTMLLKFPHFRFYSTPLFCWLIFLVRSPLCLYARLNFSQWTVEKAGCSYRTVLEGALAITLTSAYRVKRNINLCNLLQSGIPLPECQP